MMENEWKDLSGWYEPLKREEPASACAEHAEEKRGKGRGWKPLHVLCAIGLALLLLIGSSIAFSTGESQQVLVLPQIGRPTQTTAGQTFDTSDENSVADRGEESNEESAGKRDKTDDGDTDETSDEESDEMPENWADFFENYYETVTMDVADIGIERAKLPIDFELTLQAPLAEEMSLQELYANCADSIVGISAYKKGDIGYSWGTGVILSADGLILTNTHVVNNSDTATVTLFNDEEYPAKLVGADSTSDLAVLKIEAEGLTPAIFGLSSELVVGDPVAAIGNPLGEDFRCTLTNGIISAIDRGVSYNGRTMTLLQTNTALNEGNSGGALFNMYGQVIGITNMKMMSSYSSIEGIGFAIPSGTVQNVVRALVRDGEVRGRPAIGITVGAIPDTAVSHYEIPEGLYISDVTKGSDAEKQGVKPGDILTAVNGVPVRTTDDVNNLKNELQVGDQMTFNIWRNGEELEITITLMDTNDIYGR